MGREQSQTLTDYPELEKSHTWASYFPWEKHSTRKGTRMGRVMTSIRNGLAHEQEKPPTNTVDGFQDQLKFAEHPDTLQEQDKLKRTGSSSIHRSRSDASEDLRESISPAIEARKSFDANENNMGPLSHQKPTTWGWPGLGSFSEYEKLNAKLENRAKLQRSVSLEPRVEAATFEAIDSAAESESYGWPGIGMWPQSKK